MNFPSRDLTDKYISASYQDVLQKYTDGTGTYVLDGLGTVVPISASDIAPGTSIHLSQSYIISETGSFQPPFTPATIWWDDSAKTYAIYTDHSGVSLQIGQENWIRVYANEYIPNGAAVYVYSAFQGLPCVMLAIADGTGTKDDVIGLATENIQSGSIGVITSAGQVHDLDTSMFLVGDPIFLSSTNSGSYTQTIPPDPYETVALGYPLISDALTGVIQVNLSNLGANKYAFVGMTSIPSITTSSLSSSGSVVNIGTGSVNLCTTSDGKGIVKNYTLNSASFSLTASFMDIQYVVATYNSGTPIYTMVTDKSVAEGIQTTLVYTLLLGAGGRTSYTSWDAPGILLANKDNNRVQALRGVERETGIEIGVSGSTADNYITLTSGRVWQGINPLDLSSVNSATNRFVLIAHSASVWSSSFVSASIYTLYDNGTDLVNLNNNEYVVNWVYRAVGNLNTTLVQLGSNYTSLANAIASQPPTPPSELKDVAFLTGRVILRRDGNPVNRFQQVDSAYVKTFTAAGVTNHNNLNNLQGGATNEYYHLTAAAYSGLSSGTASFAKTSSYLCIGTSSSAPSDAVTPVQWINVTLSGSVYKMPLYL